MDPESQSPDSTSSAAPFLVPKATSEGEADYPVQQSSPTPDSLLIDACSPLPHQKLAADSDQLIFPSHEQAADTFKWLRDNYESTEGFSLPKSLIYDNYTAFCQERCFSPVTTSSFGKAIRHAFPQLKTRRLGARNQSKYHYYGIKMKANIPRSISDNLSSVSPQDFMVVGPNQRPSAQGQPLAGSALIWASTTLLPAFPDASNLKHTHGVAAGQVNYLISSYRSHCIQVLETVLRGGLNDVGFLIEHFWQHLNESFKGMLYHAYLADTIAVCDTHLYHTIISVLIPGTVQPLPAPLLRGIRNFACFHMKQVEKALMGLPQHLIDAKVKVAKCFAQMLGRKTTLAHLAQASRGMLCSESNSWHMKDDWAKRTEQGPDCTQMAWTSYDQWGMDKSFILKITGTGGMSEPVGPNRDLFVWTSCDQCGMGKAFILKELESYSQLLEKGRNIEDHIHWLESLVKEVTGEIKSATAKGDALRVLLLQWSYLSHLIIRDQTLRSAEYLLYVTEIHNARSQEETLWKNVFGQESQVSPYFLTSAVICDLEECNILLKGNQKAGGPDPSKVTKNVSDQHTKESIELAPQVPIARPIISPRAIGKSSKKRACPSAPGPGVQREGQLFIDQQMAIQTCPTGPRHAIFQTNVSNIPNQMVMIGSCPTAVGSAISQATAPNVVANEQGTSQPSQTSLKPVIFQQSVLVANRQVGPLTHPPTTPSPGVFQPSAPIMSTSQQSMQQTGSTAPEPGIVEPTMVQKEHSQGPSTQPPMVTYIAPRKQTGSTAPEPGIFEPTMVQTENCQGPSALPPMVTYIAPRKPVTQVPDKAVLQRGPPVQGRKDMLVQQSFQVKCPQHVFAGACQQATSRKLVRIMPVPGTQVGKAGDATSAVEPIVMKISRPQPEDVVKVTEGQVLLTDDGKSFIVNGVSKTKPGGDQVGAN